METRERQLVVKIRRICDVEGCVGYLEYKPEQWTIAVLTTYPADTAQYRHICNMCGVESRLASTYPNIVFEDTGVFEK